MALQGTNEVQVGAAKQLLSEDRYIEALAVAKDARRVDPNDYQASYYVAMAYMGLKQFDAAEIEATQALSQSPASAKPAVEKLVSTIRSLKQGNQDVGAADVALADGLIGKAARLYEDGWAAGRNAPDYALKAAELYASRLSQPVDAARVLRQVRKSLPGSPSAEQAEAELKALQPTLRQIAITKVKEASPLSLAEARPVLQAAAEADPDYPEIYRTQAQLAAASGSASDLESTLKELARRNLVDLEFLAGLPGISLMLDDAQFALQLTDIIGAGQAETLKASTSPSGRVAYLSRVARDGKLGFFMGARQVKGTATFRLWSRRKVSSVQLGKACQIVFNLSDVVGASEDAYGYQPPTRVVDLSPATALAVRNGDAIELGPTSDGWQINAVTVAEGSGLAPSIWAAMRQLHAGCPRSMTKQR